MKTKKKEMKSKKKEMKTKNFIITFIETLRAKEFYTRSCHGKTRKTKTSPKKKQNKNIPLKISHLYKLQITRTHMLTHRKLKCIYYYT